jgi:hypothetical protein
MNLRQSLNLTVVLALLLAGLSVTAAAAPAVDVQEPSDLPAKSVSTGAAPPAPAADRSLEPASPPGSPVLVSSYALQPDMVLWDQPQSAVNPNAYADQDYEAGYEEYDIFIADDFHNDYSWNIATVFVPGNTWNPGGDLTCANTLHWQIYADAGGVPDGDPWGGGNSPFWSLSLPVTDTQVTLSTGTGGFLTDVTLELASPLYLPSGSWWFVFFPQMDFDACFQYGWRPSDTTNDYDAQVINPGGGWGFPTVWTPAHQVFDDLDQQDFAFRLEGAPGCTWIELVREDFETWPPPGWTIVDNEGGGCLWNRNDTLPRPNYAGGDGYCADADTDASRCYPMDTELWSPPFDLTGAASARVQYLAAYNDITAGGGDFAQVLFSDDGGASWSELLFWDESHDPTGPGEPVDLALPVGNAASQVSFHYYGPTWDWYYEVDQVVVSACYADYEPSVLLSPSLIATEGCAGAEQLHELEVTNLTGIDATFDLSYSVPAGHGYLSGPSTLSVPAGEVAALNVAFTPELCLPDGAVVSGTVRIADPSGQYSDTAVIQETIAPAGWKQIANELAGGRMDNVTAAWGDQVWSITGYGGNANVRTYDPALGTWQSIANSAPPFGLNYARSGCQVGGVVYLYGDGGTAEFSGLWKYDMDANSWSQVTPSGAPPAQDGIWGPAWVFDPEDQLCYLTGGAAEPGEGDLSTVYVYDPAGNAWQQPLPAFDTPRNFHAAFILDQGGKQLCVAGGVNEPADLSSTQCFGFAAGAWGAEDADLGPLPAEWWGMGYSDKWHSGTEHQLWLTVGVYGGELSDLTYYYDVASGAWLPGGALPSGAVYRGSAATLNNELYHVGGSSGGFDFVGWSDRHLQCSLCGESGILEGQVFDAETDTAPTCTAAVVHVDPPDYDLSVGPDGSYITHLISGTYAVAATAPGYSVEGPVLLEIMEGMTTTRDFALARPVVEIYPEGFISTTVVISRERTLPLAIHNQGHMPLDFTVVEIGPGDDIPWVSISPDTGTVPELGWTTVDVTFLCTELGEHAGALQLLHSDPCRSSIDIPLLIRCEEAISYFFPLIVRSH